MDDKVVKEGISCGLCCHIPCWDSLGVSSKVIGDYQNILVAAFTHVECEIVHADEFHRLTGPDVNQRGPDVGGRLPPETTWTGTYLAVDI